MATRRHKKAQKEEESMKSRRCRTFNIENRSGGGGCQGGPGGGDGIDQYPSPRTTSRRVDRPIVTCGGTPQPHFGVYRCRHAEIGAKCGRAVPALATHKLDRPGLSVRRGLRRDAAATFWLCAAAGISRPAQNGAEPSRLWLRTGWIGPVDRPVLHTDSNIHPPLRISV